MKQLLFLFFFFASGPLLAQTASSTDEEPAPPKNDSSSSLGWIIPSILALGAGGYAWFVGQSVKQRTKQLEGYIKQVSSRQKKAAGGNQAVAQTVAAPQPKDDRAVQALDKRIGTLEKELEDLRAELNRKTRAPQPSSQPPTTTRPLAQTKSQAAAQQLSVSTPSVMDTVAKATAAPAPIGPQTKWAKYADAGDGFSVSALSDEQDGEKIFELLIADAVNASFRVVAARGAQQMALHDPTFYFNKACTYDTLPTPQSTITTETPGSLKLQGGKWVIQRPAKIRFS